MLPRFRQSAAAGPLLGALCVGAHRRRRPHASPAAPCRTAGCRPRSTTCRRACACSTRKAASSCVNRRYIDMYKLSPEIVRPGCSCAQLIQHRKDTGLFSGDVDDYCRKIMDGVRTGHAAPSSMCRRATAASCSPRTSRWRAAAGSPPMRTSPSSAAPRKNAPPSATRNNAARSIDAAIAAFRPQVEALLSSVSDSASAMRATAGSAVRLLRADLAARRAAPCRLSTKPPSMWKPRRWRPTNCRARSPRSAASSPTPATSSAWRPRRRAPPTARSPALPPARARSATWSS